LDNIKRLNKLREEGGYRFEIEVDGGINLDNAKEVIRAGATVLVAGSSIYGSDSVEDRVRQFKSIMDGGM